MALLGACSSGESVSFEGSTLGWAIDDRIRKRSFELPIEGTVSVGGSDIDIEAFAATEIIDD